MAISNPYPLYLCYAISLCTHVNIAQHGDHRGDGDQCSLIGVINRKYHKYFQTMCATYAFIDRADGHFNRSMAFAKDYSALIAAAYDVDSAYDQYLTNPEADAYETLKKMGLDFTPTDETMRKRKEDIMRILTYKEVKCKAFHDRYVQIPVIRKDE